MSDDEPDTDLPEDDEGMYERLVSHDSAEGSVPSVDFVNRLAERQQYMSNNPDRDYMQTHPRDRIFYFEPPVGEWTLSKFVRSPYYCVITTGVVLVFWIVVGIVVGWVFMLWGFVFSVFLEVLLLKKPCMARFFGDPIFSATPPTP
jgi:hypothetical protein